jgi:hypothetical protein
MGFRLEGASLLDEWNGGGYTLRPLSVPAARARRTLSCAYAKPPTTLSSVGWALNTGAAYHNDDDGVGVADRIVVLYQGPASARPHVIVDSPYCSVPTLCARQMSLTLRVV